MKTSSEPCTSGTAPRPQRRLAAGRRIGKRSLGDLVVCPVPSTEASSRSARRAMFCAATALVAFARILSAWASSAAAFFSALARSRLRRLSSVSRWARVCRPAHVVQVELGPVGVEMEDLVDDGAEQGGIVRDDDEPTGIPLEVVRSQATESASRWFVGSSSSRVWAPEKRIRDSSTRRRCPPERVPSACPRTRSSRPSAEAIAAASDSAAYPPCAVNSASSRAYLPMALSRTLSSALAILASVARRSRRMTSRPRARGCGPASTSRSPVRGPERGTRPRPTGSRRPRPAGPRRRAPSSRWSCLRHCVRPGRSGPRGDPEGRPSSSRRAPARSSTAVAVITTTPWRWPSSRDRPTDGKPPQCARARPPRPNALSSRPGRRPAATSPQPGRNPSGDPPRPDSARPGPVA